MWLVGTTYTNGPPPDGVIGSNGHWYVSLTSGNVGNNPVTDGGVHWADTMPPDVAIVSKPNVFTATPQTFQDGASHQLARTYNQFGSGGGVHFAGAIDLSGDNGLGPNNASFYISLDIASTTPYRDFVIGKWLSTTVESDDDGIYISHGGAGPATIGIGMSSPGDFASGAYRLKVSGDGPSHQGCVQIITRSGQTGHALNVKNPSNSDAAFIDLNGNVWATTLGAGNNNSSFAGANTLDLRTSPGACTFQMVGGSNGALLATALSTSAAVTIETSNNSTLALGTVNIGAVLIDINQGIIVGPGAKSTPAELATTATTGLFSIPTVNGTPTGAPAATTGAMPIVYDRSANKLWVYNGAWKGVVLS